MELSRLLRDYAERTEHALDARLPAADTAPTRLHQAMRYAALDGGKRIRPALVYSTGAALGVPLEHLDAPTCAVELIHAYSLVHDDLPAMDDDALRRGKPTCHIAFDEATAILAGDALLTLAFEILSAAATHEDAEIRAELVLLLARASGWQGMALGQALDLSAAHHPFSPEDTATMQTLKTGALFRFACEAGAVLGHADAHGRSALKAYAGAFGQAFQLADDLLDVTADATQMGKATGKDAAAGKATLVSIHGVEWTKRQLDGLVEQAEALLTPFGDEAAVLRATARFIADRRS